MNKGRDKESNIHGSNASEPFKKCRRKSQRTQLDDMISKPLSSKDYLFEIRTDQITYFLLPSHHYFPPLQSLDYQIRLVITKQKRFLKREKNKTDKKRSLQVAMLRSGQKQIKPMQTVDCLVFRLLSYK